MNLILLLSVTVGLFSCQCLCFNVRTTALRPRGFRACLVSEKGIESFSFYGYTVGSKPRRRWEGNVTSQTDGLWCHTKKDITLNINDEIVYWYRVAQNGEEYQADAEKIKLQASDFVDESGLYKSIITSASKPSLSRKPTGESSKNQEPIFVTPAAKVAQQEQTDFKEPGFILVQPFTLKRELQSQIIPKQVSVKHQLTTSDQQALLEIFGNSPTVTNGDGLNNAGYAETVVKLEPQEPSKTDDHDKVIEPYQLTGVVFDKKENNGEMDDRLIVPLSETNLTIQQKDDESPTKGTDEYDYPAAEDSININIIINRKATPCNTSILFGEPKIDTKQNMPGSAEDTSSSRKNKTKSCETLLSQERKLSEAVRSSYQDCVLNVNVVENDLIDSKKEVKVLNALLKETLEMINYLGVNSTNILILKSSITLIDYNQTLREVIHVLLDVTPAQYNIVKSDLEGDKIIKFEVNAYNEKLLLFLNGRIKLPGSNFQLIDYDAHLLHQKQVKNNQDNLSKE